MSIELSHRPSPRARDRADARSPGAVLLHAPPPALRPAISPRVP